MSGSKTSKVSKMGVVPRITCCNNLYFLLDVFVPRLPSYYCIIFCFYCFFRLDSMVSKKCLKLSKEPQPSKTALFARKTDIAFYESPASFQELLIPG